MTGDARLGPEAASVRDAVADATTVLLVAPGDDPVADECCVALGAADPPTRTRLLAVAVDEPPSSRLAHWRLHAGALPERTAIITVGDSKRSAAATDGGSPSPGDGPVSIDVVENPADLSGLALAIDAHLQAWAESDGDDAGTHASTTLCLHALTGLLEATSVKQVFRFLHATSGLLRRRGATGHAHLDPGNHDARTVDTLSVLFDAVVRIGEDGRLSVTTEGRRQIGGDDAGRGQP